MAKALPLQRTVVETSPASHEIYQQAADARTEAWLPNEPAIGSSGGNLESTARAVIARSVAAHLVVSWLGSSQASRLHRQ